MPNTSVLFSDFVANGYKKEQVFAVRQLGNNADLPKRIKKTLRPSSDCQNQFKKPVSGMLIHVHTGTEIWLT